jgi:hypothetical protein
MLHRYPLDSRLQGASDIFVLVHSVRRLVVALVTEPNGQAVLVAQLTQAKAGVYMMQLQALPRTANVADLLGLYDAFSHSRLSAQLSSHQCNRSSK